VRIAVVLTVAALSFAGARLARSVARYQLPPEVTSAPFAPSPGAAPFLSLGYRELLADIMFVRLRAYFGDADSFADNVAELVEAVVAVDPEFHRSYELGARAMTLAKHDVDQATYLRAIAVLEQGMARFPTDWRLPYLAGQIYSQDLQTTDPAQRRAWDERGTLLVESAIRKPGAPAEAAEWAAVMRTKLGQHERAVQGLREMLLITSDIKVQKSLLERLAKLENETSLELAAEVLEQRRRFDQAWQSNRPLITQTMYVLVGPRTAPGFDLADLASGGRDVVGSEAFERLEPVE
jgi:hypothetical protein